MNVCYAAEGACWPPWRRWPNKTYTFYLDTPRPSLECQHQNMQRAESLRHACVVLRDLAFIADLDTWLSVSNLLLTHTAERSRPRFISVSFQYAPLVDSRPKPIMCACSAARGGGNFRCHCLRVLHL